MKESKGFTNIIIVFWITSLLLSPLGIILAFQQRNAYHLGIFIGFTMLFYWVTGVLTAMKKGWKLEQEVNKNEFAKRQSCSQPHRKS